MGVMKEEQRIILISIIAALFMWVLDAVLDVIVFFSGSFWDFLILDVPPYEIYVRSMFAAGFIIFGIVISRFVAKRRMVTEALSKTEAELRRVLDEVSDYLWSGRVDAGGNFVYSYYSPVVEKVTGRPAEFYMQGPERWLSTVHPEDRDRMSAAASRLLSGGAPHDEEEYRILLPDGSVRWVRDSVRATRLADGGIRLDGVVSDITGRKKAEEELKRYRGRLEDMVLERTTDLLTANALLRQEIAERKQAEEALKESEGKFRELSQQFHTLLEAITDPLTLLSPDLRVLWRNRGSTLVSGETVFDATGQYCYTLWHNRSTPCEECPAKKSFTTGKTEVAQLESPEGRRWELRAFPVRDEGGNIYSMLTVASDVTEKLTLEAEARRVAHLASLGELAAGVAHEINNPINGIINYAQILANKSKTGSRENEIASSIIREGDRIANIVKSLLSFSRAGRTEKNPADIGEILQDSLALTETQLRKDGITLRVEVPRDLPRVLAHPQQIQQVFLNVMNNSRYALNQKYQGMHKDKILKITGENTIVDKRILIRITFYDHGIGIPAGDIDKVMNPFFSTKPRGKGTGLGLSISHGIVTDHGGNIRIESVEGEFTKVIIELPAIGEEHGKNSRY